MGAQQRIRFLLPKGVSYFPALLDGGKGREKQQPTPGEERSHAVFENVQGMKIDGVCGHFQGVTIESVCYGKWLAMGTSGGKC